MFNLKKKFSLPANAKLICISAEEYKDLLKKEIALKLLTDSLKERNGLFEIPSYEIYAIGEAMEEHFNPAWDKMIDASIAIGDGKIILMKSAIEEAEGE